MRDTTPEMYKKMSEMIRLKSPQERLEMGCSMYETSKQLVIQAILRKRPDISKTQLRQEIFLHFYHDDFTPAEREKILKYLAVDS